MSVWGSVRASDWAGVWARRRPGVADMLTLGNALCGIAAMLAVTGLGLFQSLTVTDRYAAGALLLVAGTFLDVIDGAAARRWGSTHLGAALDSLADAISFGAAPVVVLVAYAGPGASPAERSILMAGALAYTAAALIRLADFAAHGRDDGDFVGLPTTSACMGAIALGFLSVPSLGVALGLVGLAALMVSPLRYPAGTRMISVLLLGWIGGAAGIVGLVDVRVCAVLALLLILVVPLTFNSRAGTTLIRPS